MADEPVKQPADQPTDASPPANMAQGGQSSSLLKKRRRRRPRRKKRPAGLNAPGFQPVAPVVQEAKPEAKPAEEPAESLLEPAPLEPISPEPDSAPSEPEPEPSFSPEPAMPEEPKKEEEPSPFVGALKPEEAATAPQGWDQLKEAIKHDHVATEEKIAAGAAGVSAAAAVSAEEKKQEKPATAEEPKKESIPRVNPEEEDDEERKEIFRIIAKYAASGCVVIAIIGGLLFFRLPQMAFDAARNFFAGSQDSGQQQIQEEEVQIPTGAETESAGVKSSILAGENKAKSKEEFEQGVETALVTGQDSPKLREPTSAVSTVFMIGAENPEFPEMNIISEYMNVLIRLQNAFKTDIHELLSKAPNRAEALEIHIKDLNSVQNEAKETVRKINEEMDEIKVEYNQVNTLKDKLESDFFAAMDKLEGTDADEILNQFVDVSKRYTQLRAQFSALDKTKKLFDIAIKNMDVRIKDIEYNRPALIAGVKVVYIKGSDLDLIIQESEL